MKTKVTEVLGRQRAKPSTKQDQSLKQIYAIFSKLSSRHLQTQHLYQMNHICMCSW